MITEPLTSADHLEIRDLVKELAQATFTSDRVRASAASSSGYDEVAWKQLIELGWTGLGVPEEADGAGLGCVVQCTVHRELAGRLAPLPYLATAGFAAAALTALADPDQANPRLAAIAAGSALHAVAPGQGWWAPSRTPVQAREDEGRWTLDGSIPMLLDGARASELLVVAQASDGTLRLFGVQPGDATDIAARPAVDGTRSFADVTLASSPATPLSSVPVTAAAVSGAVDAMCVLLAAEMVGAATEATKQTLGYLRTRHQFGRPIGSFQALKHRCADIAVAVTVAQEMVFAAAALVDSDRVSALELAAPLAIARSAEVLKHATEEAIQLHGGVGFTDEVDIGLYYKRALVDLELLVSPADALARVGDVRKRIEVGA